jgi:hypothetical protein
MRRMAPKPAYRRLAEESLQLNSVFGARQLFLLNVVLTGCLRAVLSERGLLAIFGDSGWLKQNHHE